MFQEPAAPQRQRLDPVPGEHAGRFLQPLLRLAPAVCQRWLGGAEPGQVGPDRVLPQLPVRGEGQFGGLMVVPGAAGEDRVGVAEDSPVDPVDGQAGPPALTIAAAKSSSLFAASSSGHIARYGAGPCWGSVSRMATSRPRPSRAPAVPSSSSACIPCAPASALPSISGSPGSAAWGEREKAIHACVVAAQCLYLGEEEQPDGTGLAQPEPGAGGQCGLGVMFGFVELVAEHRDGGELQVNDRAGAGGSQLIGDTPSRGEAVGAGVVEHINGAELMQGTQPPHGEPCRVRGRQGVQRAELGNPAGHGGHGQQAGHGERRDQGA
jgi:hypothetical protein